MNEATLVRKNLFRKKARAILLIVSIFIAFLIHGALFAFNAGMSGGFGAVAPDRLVTMNRINFTVPMPYAYWGRIQALDSVQSSSPMSWVGGYYQEPINQIQTFAADPETYFEVYPELTVPADQYAEAMSRRDCVFVGRAIANVQGWELGQRIPLSSNIWQREDGTSVWEIDVCAIFESTMDNVPTNYILMHYEYFNESLAFGRDSIGWLALRTGDPDRNDEVAAQIDAMFANSPAETRTQTEAAFWESFMAMFGNIALILTLVVGAAFATILMIVGTTMVMAINERIKEVAVMKTLGFPAPRIFRMVLSESILLSLTGGLLGLLAATLMINAIGAMIADYLPGVHMPLSVALTSLGLMLALGIITGLIPAVTAMRVKIVDALGKG
jgi:putative ABC transport system permease protein